MIDADERIMKSAHYDNSLIKVKVYQIMYEEIKTLRGHH